MKTIPWNGTSGMHYANAAGLFKAHGLNVSIAREDDYAKLIADMAAFAKDNNTGSHFTIIMGDGLPAYITGLNAALKPFNQEGAMIAVFAIQLTILGYGILQDIGLNYLRSVVCPWTRLNRSDK